MQKDPRCRRILPGAFDSMVGVEESEGDRAAVFEYHTHINDADMHSAPRGEEIPAAVVDALPRFNRTSGCSHRMAT